MDFQQFGKAAVIVGLQYAVEQLQGMLDEIRAELNGAALEKPKRGRKPGSKNRPKPDAKDGWGGWSADPEERKAEMARRIAKWGKSAAKGHPRNPGHPGHKAWLENLRKAQKRIWAAKTPAERAKLSKKMRDARLRHVALVRVEQAS